MLTISLEKFRGLQKLQRDFKEIIDSLVIAPDADSDLEMFSELSHVPEGMAAASSGTSGSGTAVSHSYYDVEEQCPTSSVTSWSGIAVSHAMNDVEEACPIGVTKDITRFHRWVEQKQQKHGLVFDAHHSGTNCEGFRIYRYPPDKDLWFVSLVCPFCEENCRWSPWRQDVHGNTADIMGDWLKSKKAVKCDICIQNDVCRKKRLQGWRYGTMYIILFPIFDILR